MNTVATACFQFIPPWIRLAASMYVRILTDIDTHSAAKLYVPQVRRSGMAGARSWLYSGLDSIWELVDMYVISCQLSINRTVILSGAGPALRAVPCVVERSLHS